MKFKTVLRCTFLKVVRVVVGILSLLGSEVRMISYPTTSRLTPYTYRPRFVSAR